MDIYKSPYLKTKLDVRAYFLNPAASASKQILLLYLLRKVPRLFKGPGAFLRAVFSKALLTENGPSVLAALAYRALRYTEWGEKHRGLTAFIAACVFFYPVGRTSLKLVSTAVVACWVVEIMRRYDRRMRSKRTRQEAKAKKLEDHFKSWVFYLSHLVTGLGGGYIYTHLFKHAPGWLRQRIPVAWIHEKRLKKVMKYHGDFRIPCYDHYHPGSQCMKANITRMPYTFKRYISIGVLLQLPGLAFSHNLPRAAKKAILFASHMTFVILFCGLGICGGTNIVDRVSPELVRRVWRHWQGLFIGFGASYITSRWIIIDPKKDEYWALWFTQASVYTFINLLSDKLKSDLPFVVLGATATALLRRMLEEERPKVSFTTRFLYRVVLGVPVLPESADPPIFASSDSSNSLHQSWDLPTWPSQIFSPKDTSGSPTFQRRSSK